MNSIWFDFHLITRMPCMYLYGANEVKALIIPLLMTADNEWQSMLITRTRKYVLFICPNVLSGYFMEKIVLSVPWAEKYSESVSVEEKKFTTSCRENKFSAAAKRKQCFDSEKNHSLLPLFKLNGWSLAFMNQYMLYLSVCFIYCVIVSWVLCLFLNVNMYI